MFPKAVLASQARTSVAGEVPDEQLNRGVDRWQIVDVARRHDHLRSGEDLRKLPPRGAEGQAYLAMGDSIVGVSLHQSIAKTLPLGRTPQADRDRIRGMKVRLRAPIRPGRSTLSGDQPGLEGQQNDCSDPYHVIPFPLQKYRTMAHMSNQGGKPR